MGKPKMTTVRKMFQAYIEGCWRTMNWTSEKSDHAWGDFWQLLIMSGFCFDKDDLVLTKKYCSRSIYEPRWRGPGEGDYSLAVRAGNLSFAYAYEKFEGRMPFIGVGLDYSRCNPGFSNHATQSKSAGRLVLGTMFRWQGETVKVTSFKDKDCALVACAYHPDPEGWTPSKIKKRFTITTEDFKQAMSNERKKRKRGG